jgi:sugar phosphate isomerase/epimerase
VKVADKEVWAHHAWATKMARLANNAGVVAGSTYMEQVSLDLLSQIRSKIGKGHTNWAAFLKAVRDVDPSDLEVEMKEWRAKKDEIDTLKKHQAALQASPTAGI